MFFIAIYRDYEKVNSKIRKYVKNLFNNMKYLINLSIVLHPT
jgi:hypothetical protein